MKEYEVKLPVAGYAWVYVEADSPAEAVDKALEKVTIDDVEEWGSHRQIIQGNVFYGNCNCVTVLCDGEEVDAEGED